MIPKLAPLLSSIEEVNSAVVTMIVAQMSALFRSVIGKAPFLLWKGYLSLIRSDVKLAFQIGVLPFRIGSMVLSGDDISLGGRYLEHMAKLQTLPTTTTSGFRGWVPAT